MRPAKRWVDIPRPARLEVLHDLHEHGQEAEEWADRQAQQAAQSPGQVGKALEGDAQTESERAEAYYAAYELLYGECDDHDEEPGS